jgi:threonine-phosphate decarboxylase
MMTAPRPVHGGDLAAIAERRGVDPHVFLDFSSNVNPYGPPASVRRFLVRAARDYGLIRRYPDDTHLELRSALARMWRVPSETIVIGNGTSALLHEIVGLTKPRTCLLPTPAFSEYAHALRVAGARPIAFSLPPDRGFRLDVKAFAAAMMRYRPRLAIVNNPHNPSGAFTSALGMDRLIGAARRAGTLLLLDEAFIEYAPAGASRVRRAAGERAVVVLRSVTKLYGMPALRVGCAVAGLPLASNLRAVLPSWPVGALAAGAALEAVRDVAFAERARRRNTAARHGLAQGLSAVGCRVFPSLANFLLVRLPDGAPPATRVRERLADSRVLVRDVTSYAGLEDGCYLRLAVRQPAENRRLLRAFRDALGGAKRC